jgi:hypothetical protein
LTPKVGKTNRETSYYYDGALTEATGKKVLGDKYVMVYDRAIDRNGNVVKRLKELGQKGIKSKTKKSLPTSFESYDE